jgi:hypothetical protein
VVVVVMVLLLLLLLLLLHHVRTRARTHARTHACNTHAPLYSAPGGAADEAGRGPPVPPVPDGLRVLIIIG